MIEIALPLGSPGYLLMLGLLLLARSMDLFTTWLATPNLVLEGNPLAKRMGWKLAIVINLIVCFVFAFWHLTAIIIATSGMMVAAHNFRTGWLMRSLGEEGYRNWYLDLISQTRVFTYLVCLFGESFLIAGVGAILLLCSTFDSIPFAVGLGIIAYAAVVLFYSLLALRRIRRRMR